MAKIDRRVVRTQQALKTAIVELMSEKSFDDITLQDLSDRANVSRGTIYLHYLDKYDLLDKLIESHIHEMRESCRASLDLGFIEGTLVWTEYLDNNSSFFSMMLDSKGAPFFRDRFAEFLSEEFQNDVDVTRGKNKGLSKDLTVTFIISAYIGVIEWWFKENKPITYQGLAQQLGTLLQRVYE
ncbi:TetR/AcrR family transcriptional regulator [Paenibacillus senegalimassiliensis]|uniref:TetR/AcrR family transcriptional regulator n=1 Tax=Paenibacillus senegalimassiliensis TaxID=1737426 RepID=UPI00073F1C6D|nr:TetR/AcrR family transcriptional regulator [Paenibacillus senegalimassiliensis]